MPPYRRGKGVDQAPPGAEYPRAVVSAADQDVTVDAPEPQVPEAPPVVIVLVTHDPGGWFDETLRSIAAQTYPNTAVLVVDAGSVLPLREQIADVLPAAALRSVDADPGFAGAANEVLTAVEGAAFFLFCHDDVRLAPDAVQLMVEEAFRSNAGVVGPKIVDWHDPDQLLSVGMGADKLGYPSPYVERYELDQAQHDTVRDVFYVPGAATLVRADLFRVLGGFDDGIDYHGEDLDLAWRAHVVGARVVVAPAARVGHLEALGVRRPVDDRRKLQARHRLRASRIAYSGWSRVRVMPQAFVVALVEVVYSLLLGRFRQARDVAGAWVWNARRRGDVRRRRRALKAHRRVPDREVRTLQTRGMVRVSAFLRGQLGAQQDSLLSASRRSETAATVRSSRAGTAVIAWVVALGVLLIGSRALILDGIPAVGDFATFGDSAIDLVAEWVSGYRRSGLGAEAPNPTGLGALGILGLVTFGALGFLRQVLILGLLPLGAAGIWRLAKPIGSRRSRLVALIVFLCVPVPYNAIAAGSWASLAVWAAVPWVLSQLARASGLSPFGPTGGEPGPGVRVRPLVQRVVAVGVIAAVAAMLVPSAALLPVGLASVLVVGGLVVGQVAGAGRLLVVGLAGSVVAFVLQLPWSLGLVVTDWDAVVGVGSTSQAVLDVAAILRFETGPIGAAPLGYVFLLTAALALLTGRGWRLGWAVRSWAIVLTGMGLTWAAAEGWLPGAVPAPELVLAPAAAGIALASALGMASFEVDLPDYHFGWRQILSVLAGVALALGVLPVLAGATDGRWSLPRGDFARTLSFLDKEGEEAPFRVLWVGDAAVLPLAGWRLDAPSVTPAEPEGTTIAYATSDDGLPSVTDRWAGGPEGPTVDRLGGVLEEAAAGGTSRLGALLAPMGVRYVVVPLAPAPAPYRDEVEPRPDDLLAVLDGQLDLSTIDLPAGVVVYRNDAWGPSRAALPPGTEVPEGGALADQVLPELRDAPIALPDDDGYQRFGGELEPSVVYQAAAGSERWELEVDGAEAPRRPAFGWADAFQVDDGGQATLRYATSPLRYLALAGQAALWVVAIVYLLRVRVVTDEDRRLRARPARADRGRSAGGGVEGLEGLEGLGPAIDGPGAQAPVPGGVER
jgi:GT2 family glycosyltransferase